MKITTGKHIEAIIVIESTTPLGGLTSCANLYIS